MIYNMINKHYTHMTQDEFDTYKAWLDNEFALAKQHLDDMLNQPKQQVGKHHTNHQVAKMTYTRRVKYLNKRLDELKNIVISDKPDIEPAIVEQIAKLEEQREYEIAQSDASRHPHIRRKYSMQINKLKTHGVTHIKQPRQQYVIDYDNVPAEVLEHVKALELERDTLIATTPFERFSRCATSHSRIKRQYNIRISCLIKYGVDSTNKLPDKIAKINATKFEHWGPAMQNVNKANATKRERYGDKLEKVTNKIFATKKERYGYAHWNMRTVVETKRKLYGNGACSVESLERRTLLRKARYGEHEELIVAKSRKTKLERYADAGYTNQQKGRETKRRHWGHTGFVNNDKIQQTKFERYGHSKCDIDKRCKTNTKRYGYPQGPVDTQVQTKLHKYGSAFGDKEHIMQTNIARYDVPWFCMTEQCRNATRTKSACNHYWHDLLLDRLGIEFEFESRIEQRQFDLHFNDLYVEINPSISHNSTYGFAYFIGRTTHNSPLSIDHHKQRLDAVNNANGRLLCIWDWDSQNDIIKLISDVINKTEQLKTDDVIELDLSKEDPRLYPNYEVVKTWVQCHLYNIKTHEHIIRTSSVDVNALIASGFVEVYDCGHALLKKIEK